MEILKLLRIAIKTAKARQDFFNVPLGDILDFVVTTGFIVMENPPL